MNYNDLTLQQKRHQKRSICPICKKEVNNLQDFQYITVKYQRRLFPFFIHSECLLDSLSSSQLGEGVKNGEEIQE